MAKFFRFSGLFTKNLERQALAIAASQTADLSTSSLAVLKDKLFLEIRKHDICQELASFTLPSKFVKSESGTATLFGYLGFEAGRQPVEELISFLEGTVEIKTKRKFLIGKKIVTSLTLPTKDDMSSDKRLKLPWTSVAWPILIENGVSSLEGVPAGASHFLQKNSVKSLSHLGIQIKGVTREEMSPVSFLSEIFKDFRSKFGS